MAPLLHPNWSSVRDADMYVPDHISGSQKAKIIKHQEWPVGKKVLAEGGSRRYFIDAPMGAFMVLRTRQHGRAKMDADSGEMRQGWEALVAIMDAGGAVVVRGMPGSALGTALWAAQTDLDAALNDEAKGNRGPSTKK